LTRWSSRTLVRGIVFSFTQYRDDGISSVLRNVCVCVLGFDVRYVLVNVTKVDCSGEVGMRVEILRGSRETSTPRG
jgi:hypothetical protein